MKLLFLSLDPPGPPPAASSLILNNKLVEGADGETLPREAFLLRWNPGPEGSTYDVRVTTEELDLLAQGRRLDRAEFLVPAEALRDLPSGTHVYWQVNAHLPGGRRVDSDSFLAVVE